LETRQDYDRAILEFCNDNPTLQIYQVGEISDPGISDLDFLVLDSSPKISDRVSHFLQGGNVIIMPSTIFSKINYIEKFNLNLVQGVEIPVEKVDSKYFDLIEVIEWLPERILLIESILKNWNVSDRRVLLYLKSIDRSIRKVEKMTLSHFTRPLISDVRKTHKSLDLKRVVHEYYSCAENAWYTFSSSIREISGVASGSVNISNHYSFKNRFYKLMIYFDMLSSLNLDISKSLNSCIEIQHSNYQVDDSFMSFALERWNVLNDTLCWFRENSINSGMVKYGWFLKK
tara:strand:- start:13893 stop:14753 length:861 start_codon:yes stop_codon:yes gene_type:complete